MTKFAKLFAAITILVIAATVLFSWLWLSEDHCDKVIAQTLMSPDGKWTMVATQEECGGAAGGIYYLVHLKGDGGDVTVLDIAPIDSNDFELKWKDSRNLEIYYPGSRETYTKLNSYSDVQFVYIDTHNPKNR